MSTLRDVAARAAVSVTTVARVVRGDKYVRPEVQQRVRAAIDELAYVPNLVARSLRTGREDAIGIAVPEITDSFYAQIVQTVERSARARGMATIVTSFGDDPASEQSAVEALLSRQIVGLISVPVAADQSYLRHWQDRVAMVFIDREPIGITADNVVEDDVGGARAAVSHLIAHGHRRIAFLGDPPTVPTAGRRLEGYTAALREHGCLVDDALIRVGSDVSGDPATTLRALLDADDAPTAVFSANSRLFGGNRAGLAADGPQRCRTGQLRRFPDGSGVGTRGDRRRPEPRRIGAVRGRTVVSADRHARTAAPAAHRARGAASGPGTFRYCGDATGRRKPHAFSRRPVQPGLAGGRLVVLNSILCPGVGLAPRTQRRQRRTEGLPRVGEDVLVPRGVVVVSVAGHQSTVLQLPEPGGERVTRSAGVRLDVVEPVDSEPELTHHEQCPPVADHAQRICDSAYPRRTDRCRFDFRTHRSMVTRQ